MGCRREFEVDMIAMEGDGITDLEAMERLFGIKAAARDRRGLRPGDLVKYK
jgi:hypothetical protein